MLTAIQQLLPNEKLIYLADTQHTPYGIRSPEFIASRVHTIADFFMQHPVKLIVVACNTATAAAVNSLRNQYSVPVVGLEPALKPAIEFTNNEKVGVLATRATLDSQKYKDLRQRFGGHTRIIEKASSLFVELVESAPCIGELETQLIQQELQPFIESKVDSLVLGCTHYPFLTQTISTILGPEVRLFESALPVAREVKRRLKEQNQLQHDNQPENSPSTSYYSSAPEKALATFERLLGKKVTINCF